jgi:hypothetical protein
MQGPFHSTREIGWTYSPSILQFLRPQFLGHKGNSGAWPLKVGVNTFIKTPATGRWLEKPFFGTILQRHGKDFDIRYTPFRLR